VAEKSEKHFTAKVAKDAKKNRLDWIFLAIFAIFAVILFYRKLALLKVWRKSEPSILMIRHIS
jgi:hypothetical protein